MNKLNIYISEYVDGTLELSPAHMHYCFRDDLNYDDVKPEDLIHVMKLIYKVLKKENIKPVFLFK